MAAITSCTHIIQFEPQVGAFCNRNLVVCVKMTLTAVEVFAKLGQHAIGRRVTEASLAEYSDHIRLPVAVYASPTVAFEAEDPESAVVPIVSALGGRTALYVVFTLSLPAMLFAGSAGGQLRALRECAWTQYARVYRLVNTGCRPKR